MMFNVKILITKLFIAFTFTIVLLGTAPYAQAQNNTACPFIFGCTIFPVDQEGSDNDEASAVALVLIGGGALVYFLAKDKSENEKLRIYSNYLQGNGIRVSGDKSNFSVDLMLLKRPGSEIDGMFRNGFENHIGRASCGVDLVKVRF